MSEEPVANKSQPIPAKADAEYDLIYATVSETAQGRRFLEEYARRCRPTDTELTLAAIERMQAVVLADDGSGRMGLLLEIAEMAQTIARMRAEITALSPRDGPAAAGGVEELDTIVDVTEAATSRILAAAKQMQEIARTLREGGANSTLCDHLDAQAMKIYTACSFQDLTGQRMRKVIGVLRYLEQRINASVNSHEVGSKAQEPAGLARADVDTVTQPTARTASDERQDATLEDISRLMLAIEPSVTLSKMREEKAVAEPAGQPDVNRVPAPAADVRPELSGSETILAEADAAREMAEWAMESKVPETLKAETEASADWMVERTNAPRPESEPAWMILHRMEMELDRTLDSASEAAFHRPGVAPAPPPIQPLPAGPVMAKPMVPPPMPRAEEPGMFVASSMAQLAATLRPTPVLPEAELVFRSRLPAALPLTGKDAMAAADIKLPQPGDDDGLPEPDTSSAVGAQAEAMEPPAPVEATELMRRTAAIVTEPSARNNGSSIQTMPLAAETEADDFLFAPDTNQTHADADVFATALQSAPEPAMPESQDVMTAASKAEPEWESKKFRHSTLVAPQAVGVAETAQASPVETEQASQRKVAPLANDPLAPIRALSDAQKIALFS